MKPRHKAPDCNFIVDVDGDFWYIDTWESKQKRYYGVIVSYVGIIESYSSTKFHTYRDLVAIKE